MILNSKQLEELENIQDASGEFEEEAGDPDGYAEGVENALAWRRGMVERAVNHIRKLVRKPLDTMEGVANGSLVYLKDSKRFVRVHENQDGKNELSFVGPTPTPAAPPKAAKKEKTPKAPKPVKAQEAPKPPKPVKEEKASKPVKKEKEAQKPAPKAVVKAKDEKPVVAKKSQAKAVQAKKAPAAKATSVKVTKKLPSKPVKKAPKAVVPKAKAKKPAATKKVVQKPKAKVVAKKPLPKKMPKKSALPSKGAPSRARYMDPVADPNSYIRSNFRLMSNKELSNVTGLSEHTIRRKLGEWGLKRI